MENEEQYNTSASALGSKNLEIENEIPPRSSKGKIIGLVIAGIFVLSGLAYGSWYSYENFFHVPELGDLLADLFEKNKEINIYEGSVEFDLEASEADGENLSPINLDFATSLIGENINLSVKTSGFIDKSDPDNIKSEGNFLLSGGSAFGKLGLEIKSLDKKVYLKIVDIPLMAAVFLDPKKIKDVWVKIDKKEDSLLNKYGNFFEDEDKKDEEEFDKKIEKVKNALREGDILEVIKKCANETVEEEKVINCQFKLKADSLKVLLDEIKEAPEQEKTEDNFFGSYLENIKEQEKENWEKTAKFLENMTFDISFTKKDHYLSNLKIFYKPVGNEGTLKKAVFEAKINNFVEPRVIEEPMESTDIEKMISDVMGGVMGNMMSGDAIESGGTLNSTEDSQANMRAGKIISDVKQMQTALELYFNDNKRYPDDLSVIQESGFMTSLPEYPPTSSGICAGVSYVYVVKADKQDYTLSYCLENDRGGISKGNNVANNRGANSGNPEKLTSEDIDKDGLNEYEEINVYKTDPNDIDTDKDGYSDGDEVKKGYNPNGPGKL